MTRFISTPRACAHSKAGNSLALPFRFSMQIIVLTPIIGFFEQNFHHFYRSVTQAYLVPSKLSRWPVSEEWQKSWVQEISNVVGVVWMCAFGELPTIPGKDEQGDCIA